MDNSYIYIACALILIALALLKDFGALLVVVLFWGFYLIVVNNKKFHKLKDKFEKAF